MDSAVSTDVGAVVEVVVEDVVELVVVVLDVVTCSLKIKHFLYENSLIIIFDIHCSLSIKIILSINNSFLATCITKNLAHDYDICFP